VCIERKPVWQKGLKKLWWIFSIKCKLLYPRAREMGLQEQFILQHCTQILPTKINIKKCPRCSIKLAIFFCKINVYVTGKDFLALKWHFKGTVSQKLCQVLFR
jgi:hypothetical protein